MHTSFGRFLEWPLQGSTYDNKYQQNQPKSAQLIQFLDSEAVPVQRPRAYISKNSTRHYLPDRAYLGQQSGQNSMKE